MKINIAKSAGFCFGVRRALKIALDLVKSGKSIEMLGDIVHNEDVVREIKKMGIKKIVALRNGKGKILLIRAHGASSMTIKKALRHRYKIIDATCPMVKEIHRIAAHMERKGYRIIIIGDKHHDEVRGIAGQIKSKAIIIDGLKNIPWGNIRKINKAAVVVQSTQNISRTLAIVKTLKLQIKKLVFFNTICAPTRLKQEEIKTLPLKNDMMLVIGSRKSANTRRLFEIARSLNKRSYWVNSGSEIKPIWFRKAKNIGITSGSSTPSETTQKIIKYIRAVSQ